MMGIVFLNEHTFWEGTKLFVKKGVVQTKKNWKIDEPNGLFKEMKKDCFFLTDGKNELSWSFKTDFVLFFTERTIFSNTLFKKLIFF